jgi:hypothetical protein
MADPLPLTKPKLLIDKIVGTDSFGMLLLVRFCTLSLMDPFSPKKSDPDEPNKLERFFTF